MREVQELRQDQRRGVILPVVLFVLVLIGLLAAMYSFRVNSDLSATQAVAMRMQTRLAAEAGIEYVRMVLRTSRFDRNVWYNNPDIFNRIIVTAHGHDAKTAGTNQEFDDNSVFRFSIVADDPTDDKDYVRFGITDEASKLNLNAATEAQLLTLVTAALGENTEVEPQQIVDAILDWRDDDTLPRGEAGDTERTYYSALPKPYRVKNGPFDTVEELLLVKGVTPAILYGEDFDRNGLLTQNEKDGDRSFPDDNQDDVLNRGLYAYLTVLSKENNVANDNRPRIYLAGEEAATRTGLTAIFPDEPNVVDYILQNAKAPSGQGGDGGTGHGGKQGQQGQGSQGGQQDQPGHGGQPGGQQGDVGSQTGQQGNPGGLQGGTQPTGGQGGASGGSGAGSGSKPGKPKGTNKDKQPPTGGTTPPQGQGGSRGQAGTKNPRGSSPPQGGLQGGEPQQGGQGQESGQPTDAGQPQGQQQGSQPQQQGAGDENQGPKTSPDGDDGGGAGDGGSGQPSGNPPITSPASLMLPRKDAQGNPTASALTLEHLAVLMDKTTMHKPEERTIPGLINVNTAPPAVLACLEGIGEEHIQKIMAKRDTLDAATLSTTAWLVTENVMDLVTYEKLAPSITARGQQFTIESVGYADYMGMVTRLQVVVDMNGPIAQTVYYRDISNLGGTYPIRESDKEKIRGH